MAIKSKYLIEQEKMCEEALNQIKPEGYLNFDLQDWVNHFSNIMVPVYVDTFRICLRYTNSKNEPIIILYKFKFISKLCNSINFKISDGSSKYPNVFEYHFKHTTFASMSKSPLQCPEFDDIPGDHFIMYR